MRRRRRALGETARKGPRTGVLEVDWTNVATAAYEVVDRFKSCGADDTVKPAEVGSVMTYVRDAQTGKTRKVMVSAIPDQEVKHFARAEHRRYTGSKKQVFHDIVVYPKADLCMPRDDWRTKMQFVLTHELTHASEAEKQKPRQGERGGGNVWEDYESCKRYVNNPREVAAFVAEARQELSTSFTVKRIDQLVRKGVVEKPGDMLTLFSDSWNTVVPCITPENRRRFLKMAAHLWEQRGYKKLGE